MAVTWTILDTMLVVWLAGHYEFAELEAALVRLRAVRPPRPNSNRPEDQYTIIG